MLFLKWNNRLNKLFEVFLGISFGLMTLFIFLQVLVRFVFTRFGLDMSVPWTEEISRYIMIWAVFIGAAVAMRKDNMIKVDAFVNVLPATVGKIVKVITLLLTIVFFIYLLFISYGYVVQGMDQKSPVMGIPMAIPFLSILFGSVLMILNIVGLLLESYLTKKDIRFMAAEEEDEYLNEN